MHNSKITTICLDLDGVMCDWMGSVCTLLGVPKEEILKKWKPGEYNIEEFIGHTEQEVWDLVDRAGEDFWAEMPELPWARDLWELANKKAPEVYFLSSPAYHPTCLAGKLKWIRKFTGNPKDRSYILTPHKHKCSMPGVVLIDDTEKMVDKFNKGLGVGLLFPQLWNKMHMIAPEHKFEYVRRILEDITCQKSNPVNQKT